MIASDPLSYLFLGCFFFSAVFLVITTVLGIGHGHILGAGGHGTHLLHAGGHHIGGHSTSGHATNATSSATGGNGAINTGSLSTLTSLMSLLLDSLSLYGLLILLLIFGLLGYLLHNYTNIGVDLSLLVAIVAGVGSALLVSSLLSSLFLNREVGVLGAESSQFEGRLGVISMAIRANGIGEVIYTNTQGGRQSMGARSTDGEAIPAGTDIVILSTTRGIAFVQAWDRFMIDVPPLEPIDTD